MQEERRRSRKQEVTENVDLIAYERQLWSQGTHLVAGIDEVGRGPLAGPVAAAAVILPQYFDIPGLNDSKKLTPSKRAELEIMIKQQALAWSVGVCDVEYIDKHNIYQATLEAMRRAVRGLHIRPLHLLIDFLRIPHLDLPQTPIVGGDGLSASIAAASIVAKVFRDRMMVEFDAVYPGYGFGKHKGYATLEHFQALQRLGPCQIHRRSFCPVKEWDQLELFHQGVD